MEQNGNSQEIFKRFSNALDQFEKANNKNKSTNDFFSPIITSVITGILLFLLGSGLGFISKPINNEKAFESFFKEVNYRLELIQHNFEVLSKESENTNHEKPDLNKIKPIKDEK